MLKINKLMAIALLVGLSISSGMFLTEGCFADQTNTIASDFPDSYGVKHRTISYPNLDIDVWVDKGEGVIYHPGEDVKVYFRASRDCYVVIYDIDTRGYVHLLYPVDQRDDPYVEGGRVYRVPDRFDDYELTVDGPSGVEYVQAVASFEPIALPNFDGVYSEDEEIYAYRLDDEDPFEFMAEINAEIVSDDYASDVCVFNVEYPHPQWYYWPRVVYVERPVDIMLGGLYFDYPWGVEVWIDGVFYGITPLTIPYLVVGRHYASFWFHGCWVWRDWVHVRRDRHITVWADCHDRYRYLEDRVVEKSYRAEKAKRRRGVEEVGRLVKPVGYLERGRIVKAESYRMEKNKEFKKELKETRRGVKDRPTPLQPSFDSKSTKMERKSEPKIIRRSLDYEKKRPASDREIKTKERRIENKTSRKVRGDSGYSKPKERSITTEKIRKNDNPRPEAKASKITRGDGERQAVKSTTVGKSPGKIENRTKGGATKSERPQGRRK